MNRRTRSKVILGFFFLFTGCVWMSPIPFGAAVLETVLALVMCAGTTSDDAAHVLATHHRRATLPAVWTLLCSVDIRWTT